MSVRSVKMQQTRSVLVSLIALAAMLFVLIGFRGAISQLVSRWSNYEEYSHGFLIPVVTIWLLWVRRDVLRASIGRPSWAGPVVALLAVVMNIVGQLSAMFVVSQVGLIVAIIGLILALGGYSLLKAALFPIAFLLFAIPVPDTIDTMASLKLQFVSSELGTLFIRLFGIPVYLEGNIIDLGNYKI